MKPLALLLAALILAGCQSTANLPATFIIFFQSGSTALTADAQASIVRAADAARASGATRVTIASGVAQGDNLRLAEPRYQEVIRGDYIVARSKAPDTSS